MLLGRLWCVEVLGRVYQRGLGGGEMFPAIQLQNPVGNFLLLCLLQGSAAAPISRSVLEAFLDFDFPIYELYGMSESSGPQTISLIGKVWCDGKMSFDQ